MHEHGHLELAKKLNDKVPKTIDEMWERVRAFIRGETVADTTEVIIYPWWEKSVGKASSSKNQNGSEIEVIEGDNVNFPPPPPMVRTPEKRNMNKFCDYHQDRGRAARRARAQPKEKEKVINMVRSQGYRKRPYDRVEHWMDNTIAFILVPRYQLMDWPVVVDALIEGSGSEGYMLMVVALQKRSQLPLGVIDLEVTIGEYEKTRIVIMEFAVVKSPSPYNTLLDPSLMQTSSEVTNPRVSLALVETRSRRPGKEPMKLYDMEERQQLDKGNKLPKSSVEEKIVNVDIFAWTLADMMDIPHAITEHSLDTYPHIEPKVKKKISLAPDKRKVVTDEVNEWLKAGIIRRMRYPLWVSNPELVKKLDGSWRMCIDFIDLSKACSKDLYPLPEIDWNIEPLMGFQYKCFLDTYKGSHQIHMTNKDEEKTDFHTEEGVFCYTKMAFGLKNAGATLNLEAYVYDMMIKSRTE
ncbi:hypothetical protein Tco_0858685 [Tanacetum coccineum]|uniref:Uncharacterized protein n=1 Tax=Tanacetum coccineum TaxID=301880 RepID=A0ABQ5BDU8_9ASTR